MTSTTMYFTPGCPVMKSKDLINWEIIGYVYDTLDDNDSTKLQNGKHDYGYGSWASSLRYENGKFYVAFAAYNTGKTYIFQTTDIEIGTWQKFTLDGIYHDMSLLFDDDGRVYMVYGAETIKVIELTEDATAIKPCGLNKAIIENADISGRKSLAEGSQIYKLNGYYYNFMIVWPNIGTRRRIQVCYRAKKIDGAYEGKIVLDDDIGFQNAGVAQGGIIDSPNGKWYGLLFQDHGAVGRVPVLLNVEWEKDWPVFCKAVKVPTAMPAIVKSDDFAEKKLGLTWQWNHNSDKLNWSLTARPGWLRLTTGNIAETLTAAKNTLTQRTFGPKCTGEVCLDVSRMKNGDFAGLAALQDQYGFVGVKMTGGKKHIVMAKAPESRLHLGQYKTSVPHEELASVPLEQDRLYLRIEFNFENVTDTADFYYSLDGSDRISIGKRLNMIYLLSHFTGYRFALFNYSTETVGGHVDFDFLKVEEWFHVENSNNWGGKHIYARAD